MIKKGVKESSAYIYRPTARATHVSNYNNGPWTSTNTNFAQSKATQTPGINNTVDQTPHTSYHN